LCSRCPTSSSTILCYLLSRFSNRLSPQIRKDSSDGFIAFSSLLEKAAGGWSVHQLSPISPRRRQPWCDSLSAHSPHGQATFFMSVPACWFSGISGRLRAMNSMSTFCASYKMRLNVLIRHGACYKAADIRPITMSCRPCRLSLEGRQSILPSSGLAFRRVVCSHSAPDSGSRLMLATQW
jgi:hypothetical protein